MSDMVIYIMYVCNVHRVSEKRADIQYQLYPGMRVPTVDTVFTKFDSSIFLKISGVVRIVIIKSTELSTCLQEYQRFGAI